MGMIDGGDCSFLVDDPEFQQIQQEIDAGLWEEARTPDGVLSFVIMTVIVGEEPTAA
ncbi:MAG: hypothetical protein RLZZ324_618 [Candidatus Parcubacteria bacterium]|jgi:hypothetical protein